MKKGLPAYLQSVELTTEEELIVSEFKEKGMAVITWLKMFITKEHGYYCTWNDDVAFLFAKRNGTGKGVVSEIVRAALRRGIYDRDLFEKYAVLTSAEFQEGFLNAAKRWKEVELIREYLLVRADQIPKNANIISINADILKENAYIPDTIECNRTELKVIECNREKAGTACRPLTQEEFNSLSVEFGEEKVKEYIIRVNSYCEETGKSYENPALIIRKWIIQDKGKDKDKPKGANRFSNYTDTNEIDFKAHEEQIMKEMLEP